MSTKNNISRIRVDKSVILIYNYVPNDTLFWGEMMTAEEISKNCILFKGCFPEKEEFSDCETKKYPKGSIIFGEEDFIKAAGIITKGKICIRPKSNPDGKLLEKGKYDVFGVSSVFGGSNEFSSVIKAKADTEILFLSEEKIGSLFAKYPEFALNYTKFLVSRINFLCSKVSELAASDISGRLYEYLKNTYPDGEVGKMNIADISRRLSAGRTSVYRAVDTLIKEGKAEKTQNGGIKLI